MLGQTKQLHLQRPSALCNVRARFVEADLGKPEHEEDGRRETKCGDLKEGVTESEVERGGSCLWRVIPVAVAGTFYTLFFRACPLLNRSVILFPLIRTHAPF